MPLSRAERREIRRLRRAAATPGINRRRAIRIGGAIAFVLGAVGYLMGAVPALQHTPAALGSVLDWGKLLMLGAALMIVFGPIKDREAE